jgi:hypothetical protein
MGAWRKEINLLGDAWREVKEDPAPEQRAASRATA